jgi:hypothetical protein
MNEGCGSKTHIKFKLKEVIMIDSTTKTREELQFAITSNNRKHTSVQSIERLRVFHFSIYNKYFADKTEGYIYNKMNANGTWTWKWFADGKEAVVYMNR